MNPTHAIITFSKVHHLVTEDQAMKISMLPPDGEAMIDGKPPLIKRNNVADIITIEQYYRNFPQKKDQQSLLPKNDPKLLEAKGIDGIIRDTNSVFALEQIKKGLEKYIKSFKYKGTDAPQGIIDQINKKIKLIQNNETSIS